MKRFRTGWDLTKKSWRLLRSQPGLTAYPVVGGVLAVVAFVVLSAGVAACVMPGRRAMRADPAAVLRGE